MSKTLIVAEKPSVARDIASAMGKIKKNGDFYEDDKYVVTSAVGHLVELFMPQDYDKKLGRWTLQNLPINPLEMGNKQFGLKPIEKTKKQFNLVKKLMKRKDVECVINACDAGREGELIFMYLYDLAGCKIPFKRLWMQSMTPASIREAFENLRSPEQMAPLNDAAKSRSEADWLIGINGTRSITSRLYGSRVKAVATVGRVQTPTLMMVLERELLIRNFKPTPFWRITADFGVELGDYKGVFQREDFNAKKKASEHDKVDRLWDEATADEVLAKVKAISTWEVTETTKRGEMSAPKLYDLTTLQREANSRFGFPAAMTLKVAQALYERHKVLTYPRTDSQALPEDYIGVVKRTLGNMDSPFAQQILDNDWVRPNKRIFDNKKISDHFAIIPTGEKPKNLPEPEQKVYDMVCKRFMAIFFPPAKIDNTVRLTQAEGITFKTEGKVLAEPGWMEVQGRTQLGGDPLVGLSPSDENKATLKEAEKLAEETRPPARYSEATLLSAMESAGKSLDDDELAEAMKERGLGTPATRASIIDHLIRTGYMERERKELIPTAKAESLYEFLKAINAEALTKAEMTGEWEYQLRQIEQGKLSRDEFMKGIGEMAKSIVDAADAFEEASEPSEPLNDILSPTDQKPMLRKTRFFESQDGKVRIWKVISGRKLAESELKILLEKGEIGPLEGFVSKFGRKFEGKLKLDEDFSPKFDFGDQAQRSAISVEDLKKGEQMGPCPNNDGQVYAHENGYACENAVGEKPTCGFKLPKTMLQRTFKDEEVKKLLADRESPLLMGFTSKKTGKKFNTVLYFRKDGKLGWKFPARPKKTDENTSTGSAQGKDEKKEEK